MVAVRVVEGLADGEVRVVAVRDELVPAAGRVALAALHRGAGAGAAPAHLESVLVRVPLVGRVEVPVVQVVGVVAMPDLPVAAARAVPVFVVGVLAAGHGGSRGSSPGRNPASILPGGAKMPGGGVA